MFSGRFMIHERDRSSMIQRGAAGALVGATYGLAECLFSGVASQFSDPAFEALHVATHGMLIAGYAALGGLIAIAVSAAGRPRCTEAVTLSVFLVAQGSVFALLRHDASLRWALSCLTSFGLAGVVIASRSGVRAFARPWAAFFIALGVPWLLFGPLDCESRQIKLGAAIAFTLAVAFVARVVGLRWRPSLRSRAAVVLVSCAALLGVAQGLQRQLPLRFEQARARAGQALSSLSVVLISLDTVRADHLSVYGYPFRTTPSLERMAHSATLYTHTFSAANIDRKSVV